MSGGFGQVRLMDGPFLGDPSVFCGDSKMSSCFPVPNLKFSRFRQAPTTTGRDTCSAVRGLRLTCAVLLSWVRSWNLGLDIHI